MCGPLCKEIKRGELKNVSVYTEDYTFSPWGEDCEVTVH